MLTFVVCFLLTISVTVALLGCSIGKSSKSSTATRKTTSNPTSKQKDQPQLKPPKKITSTPVNPPKPSTEKLQPSPRPSESGEKEKFSKKPIIITPQKLPSAEKVATRDRGGNTYLDETQQSRLSGSEAEKDGNRNKKGKSPGPDATQDHNKTEDKQLSKTPATEAKTIDVVPATKVKVLGELDKAILQRRAQILKEIEEMGSVHDFDKPTHRHSVEKAEPIDPNKHVVVAEDKFKLYIISSDEVIEEQPTQKSH